MNRNEKKKEIATFVFLLLFCLWFLFPFLDLESIYFSFDYYFIYQIWFLVFALPIHLIQSEISNQLWNEKKNPTKIDLNH